ncbi:MAG: phosphatase PAP2 family protein [Dysgonamonadaceae bacterium]|jgi:undecaprenyl-diphosphatase|nr:phosphatase PAP2 family protein [Dysgonamonadaceae bacterium]
MLEQELQWERALFFFLNGSESAFWDRFFYLYSDKWIWLPFYGCFLGVFFYKKHWKEGFLLVLASVLLILLCDQIASGVFKPLFHRSRPTHHPDFAMQVKTVLGYRGGRYGFLSSHAANAFGFAGFTALIFRNKWFSVMIFCFATINAYSRVYLGVHFLSDVVGGALLGLFCAWIVFVLYRLTRQKCLRPETGLFCFPKPEIRFLCLVYCLFIIVLLLFNNQLFTAI